MDTLTFANETPVLALGWAAMSEAGVPCQRDDNRSAIYEFDNERIFGHRHMLRPCFGQVTLQR
jgi:hypothetical protein